MYIIRRWFAKPITAPLLDGKGQMAGNILIMTYGTRGDVEPLLALALGLKRRGHAVLLVTSERFGEWIGGHDIDFAPVSDDGLALIETDEAKAMLDGSAGWLAKIAAGRRLTAKAGPIMDGIIAESWRIAAQFRPDAIVFHPKMLASPHIAEKLGIPVFLAALQPMFTPTSAFPVPGLPRLPLPGWNRLSYRLAALGYGLYRKSVNRLRVDDLGLTPVMKAADVLEPPALGPLPILHAISPQVLARPPDWPARAHLTGYWRLPAETDYVPDPAFAAFLDGGPPPVYAGFGSMPSRDPDALGRTVIAAIRAAGMRGVIGSGWGGMAVNAADDIHIVGSVPHDWLFARMAAVIHHGGAGTTAAAFHAGVPGIVCPFGVDQYYWGDVSSGLGVGPQPLPQKQLTVEALAGRIRTAVGDASMRQAAKALGETLRAEDGIAVAIGLIEAGVNAWPSLEAPSRPIPPAS